MFCENCGKEIESTSKFCTNCGAVVENETLTKNDGVDTNMFENGMMTDSEFVGIFVEPDENYIGSLGDCYLNSFLTSQKIKRCIALLSDKRVYLRGNMIDINGGKFSRTNIQKTIDLEDITGTGFIYVSAKLWKLILAFLLGLLALLFLGCFLLEELEGSSIFQVLVSLVSSIPTILLIVSYIKARKTLFFIEYAGGCIKFDASIYGLAESQDFEKQIRRAKNKVKENK